MRILKKGLDGRLSDDGMTWRFLKHISDLFIEAKGKNLKAALEDLAAGMFTQMGGNEAKEVEGFELEVSGATKEELIVNALSNIIAECEIRSFTPVRMTVLSLDMKKNYLRMNICGEKKVPNNIIKAVTYHKLKVERTKKGWLLRVLFDI